MTVASVGSPRVSLNFMAAVSVEIGLNNKHFFKKNHKGKVVSGNTMLHNTGQRYDILGYTLLLLSWKTVNIVNTHVIYLTPGY